MQQTKRFGTGTLTRRTGSEGPRHDPYSYTEWTVKRGERHVTLHLGLATWVKINNLICDLNSENQAVSQFEHDAGITLKACDRALDHVSRCCSKMRPVSKTGYPGEHFTVCGSCGKHLDYYFCISEVE